LQASINPKCLDTKYIQEHTNFHHRKSHFGSPKIWLGTPHPGVRETPAGNS